MTSVVSVSRVIDTAQTIVLRKWHFQNMNRLEHLTLEPVKELLHHQDRPACSCQAASRSHTYTGWLLFSNCARVQHTIIIQTINIIQIITAVIQTIAGVIKIRPPPSRACLWLASQPAWAASTTSVSSYSSSIINSVVGGMPTAVLILLIIAVCDLVPRFKSLAAENPQAVIASCEASITPSCWACWVSCS